MVKKKRVGILTSGGDCPGLNAVIRGAVKSCHQLGYDCVGFLKGYEGLYDPVQYVHLTPKSTSGILDKGGTILGSTNKGRFAATVGVSGRQELDPELIAGVKQTVHELSIDGLICVGGDGSLMIAQQFHENGIPVVGVPKTIDNDLSATAFTFGFDSAVECATDALDRLHTTAASHERIMVLEVMGRHAGWIALHAGIAGGGDVILIPEIPWSFDHVCHKILHRESRGTKFTLVVVAEGAHFPDGGLMGERREGAQMKLGGIGRAVADGIERRLHRETRLSVLGHLQRGGKPTTFDRSLATMFGAHAVRLIKEERFGEMICSHPPEMKSVPIAEAVNVLRTVDVDCAAVQAARALGVSFGDRPADEIGEDVFALRMNISPVIHLDPTPTPAPECATLSELVEQVNAAPLTTAVVVEESIAMTSDEPARTEEDKAELEAGVEIEDEVAALALEMTLEAGAATEVDELDDEDEPTADEASAGSSEEDEPHDVGALLVDEPEVAAAPARSPIDPLGAADALAQRIAAAAAALHNAAPAATQLSVEERDKGLASVALAAADADRARIDAARTALEEALAN